MHCLLFGSLPTSCTTLASEIISQPTVKPSAPDLCDPYEIAAKAIGFEPAVQGAHIISTSPAASTSPGACLKTPAVQRSGPPYPQGGYAIPDWLYTPAQSSDLATDEPYLYLAGKLLQAGLASAPNCPYNGLLPNGFASPCGLEAARPQVTDWQNRFDEAIYKSSVENAVPANLLKRIFAQESQFWLGQSADNQHFGIGQITEGGIDPLFLSYPDYYKLVCTDVLSAETCKSKYAELSDQNKALIRGYFLRTVIDASCPDCAEKYDSEKAQETDRYLRQARRSQLRAGRPRDHGYHRAKTRHGEHLRRPVALHLAELQRRLGMRLRCDRSDREGE